MKRFVALITATFFFTCLSLNIYSNEAHQGSIVHLTMAPAVNQSSTEMNKTRISGLEISETINLSTTIGANDSFENLTFDRSFDKPYTYFQVYPTFMDTGLFETFGTVISSAKTVIFRDTTQDYYWKNVIQVNDALDSLININTDEAKLTYLKPIDINNVELMCFKYLSIRGDSEALFYSLGVSHNDQYIPLCHYEDLHSILIKKGVDVTDFGSNESYSLINEFSANVNSAFYPLTVELRKKINNEWVLVR